MLFNAYMSYGCLGDRCTVVSDVPAACAFDRIRIQIPDDIIFRNAADGGLPLLRQGDRICPVESAVRLTRKGLRIVYYDRLINKWRSIPLEYTIL